MGVAGNGARLRVDCRDTYNNITVFESNAVTGTTGSNPEDHVTVSVSGTIPSNTVTIYIEVCGSTNQGPGAGSSIEFDDVVFKTTKAAANDWPSIDISASDMHVTGYGTILLSWGNAQYCSNAQMYGSANGSTMETLLGTGTSGSHYFNGAPGNTYTFRIYEGTNHTRLLDSVTVVFHPETPEGAVIDDYEDGYTYTTTFSSDISASGRTETQGTLRFYTTGTNPYLIRTSGIAFSPTTYDTVKIRMKVNHGDTTGKFYWKNAQDWDEARSHSFTVINDGKWHEYELDLSSDTDWTNGGNITGFRLDPVTSAGAIVEVDYIVVVDPDAVQTWNAIDDFGTVQGQNGWSYSCFYYDGGWRTLMMTWWTDHWGISPYYSKLWIKAGAISSQFHPACLIWSMPSNPTFTSVNISGNAHDMDGAGAGEDVTVYIIKNGAVVLWSATITNGDSIGYNFNVNVNMNPSDFIMFWVVGANNIGNATYFNPTITSQ